MKAKFNDEFRCLLLFLLLILPVVAQAQTIRGKITDAQTGQPIPDAIVSGMLPEQLATYTDSTGNFSLRNLKPGRYSIQISHLSYNAVAITELVVSAGKETVINTALEPKTEPLQEVEIRPEPANIFSTETLSTNWFTVEQTQRFAAAFYDPARLATSFAGVTNTDDQANNLSIRGNSPAGVLWRLEGVNIVNPNHLANAGTFTDRATPTGGGVNILSAQLLSHSRLLTGAFAPGYGNTVAGVMDMRLRNGNNQKREHTLQASLLGLDLATEGPISVEKGSSYLVNYRYSTVGLLTALGVQFGNEEITYHDLSFHVNLPTAKAGNFRLFGIAGSSRNLFTAPENRTDWEFEKDTYNIGYTSEMGAIGLVHEVQLGNKTRLNTTVALSGLANNRKQEDQKDLWPGVQPNAEEEQRENLVSAKVEMQRAINAKADFNIGFFADRRATHSTETYGLYAPFTKSYTYTVLQPYLNGKWQILPRLQLQAGFQYLMWSDKHSLEPRGSLKYAVAPGHALQFSAGRYSQVPPVSLLLSAPFHAHYSNADLDLLKSDQYVLGYAGQISGTWSLKSEVYYQRHFNVPVSDFSSNTFSAINYLNEPVFDRLKNEGTGKNYGLEITAEKKLVRNYYALLAGTLYNSVYTDAHRTERSTRFNGRYALSATAGKEWHWSRNEKPKETGLHLRGIYRGGLRDTPINLATSEAFQQTVYFQEQAYSVQLPAYFRLDLRLSLRTYRPRSTRLLYLDIQNVTAYQNVAFRYYDAFQNKILTRYQLGIIPVLGYRVEF